MKLPDTPRMKLYSYLASDRLRLEQILVLLGIETQDSKERSALNRLLPHLRPQEKRPPELRTGWRYFTGNETLIATVLYQVWRRNFLESELAAKSLVKYLGSSPLAEGMCPLCGLGLRYPIALPWLHSEEQILVGMTGGTKWVWSIMGKNSCRMPNEMGFYLNLTKFFRQAREHCRLLPELPNEQED